MKHLRHYAEVKIYSRLCVGKGTLVPLATSLAGPYSAERHSKDGRSVIHVPPLGNMYKHSRTEFPFFQWKVSEQRNKLLHYVLPDEIRMVDSPSLTVSAILKAPDPGKWKGVVMSQSEMPVSSPEDEYKLCSDIGWSYRALGDNEVETIRYSYTYYPPQYYGHPAVIIEASRYLVRLSESGEYLSIYNAGSGQTDFVCPASEIDDGLCQSEAWKIAHSEPSPTPIMQVDATWLDCDGKTESYPITDLFNERARFWGEKFAKHQYEFDWLTQHAFMDACSEIGKMNDNMIQNIVEIVSLILTLCQGKPPDKLTVNTLKTKVFDVDDVSQAVKVRNVQYRELIKKKKPWPSRVADGWLSYRYQYGTTMLDLHDFSDFLLRRTEDWLNFMNKNYYKKSFGYASRMVDGILVECRCKIAFRPRLLDGLHQAAKYLHETGLEANPYVLWDFVPFSFIADWFVPIGDTLSVISDSRFYTDEYYDFKEISFSIKYKFDNGSRYYRWYGEPPLVEGYMWLDKGGKSPSRKTVTKRILDTGALIWGIASSKLPL